MNITFECADKINGVLTAVVEPADYSERVEKKLKEYRKKMSIPGFRPGMVPMTIVKKQFGLKVKADEINHMLGERIYQYIGENKIEMLGEPMSDEDKQPQINFEKDEPLTFVFDIAVAPAFNADLSAKDKIDYYKITVTDDMVQNQVDTFRSRAGRYEKARRYEPDKRDMLKGDLKELDDKGTIKEGGITVIDAVMMPEYIKDEEEKKKFSSAEVGGAVRFNPKKAYPGSDGERASLLKISVEEAANVESDFSYEVKEVSRYVPHPVDQELFDQVYGQGTVKDEADFRQKIKEGLEKQLERDSDLRFLYDLRKYMEKKIGCLTFPEKLIKRMLKKNAKTNDDPEKYAEEHYQESVDQLTWHLIREQLVKKYNIKVNNDEVKQAGKEMTRAQFASYGMRNLPDDYVERYVGENLLKKEDTVQILVDRVIDVKLIAAAKTTVKLNGKNISLEEFNKLTEEK